MTTERAQCKGTTKAGNPCKSWPVNGSDLCALHSPNAKEIQRKGGQHKSLQHRLEQHRSPDLQRVTDLLIKSLGEVHDGKLRPSVGSSLAALGSSVLKVREQSVVEERIRLLESKAKRTGGRR